jgi:ubiquinone/menaquinone biosynthesis C-methylase UbiE
MYPSYLDLLKCTRCSGEARLELRSSESAPDGDVIVGELRCTACRATFAITNGVARFVPADGDYCKNFGFQWQRWKEIQIDRLSHHHMSESRFFNEVPWDRAWMKDKLILDCGCGAGRFADVAAQHAGRLVACDISGAIDAARDVTRTYGARVLCVQASIYELPFRKGTFDGLYCLGVIQHTPDPRKTMESMPPMLKPGGLLAYDFYQRTNWERPYIPRWFLRRFTPNWTTDNVLRLAHALTATWFPLAAAVAKTPVLNHLQPALPIAITVDPELSWRQRYVMSLLDTFDLYGPKYEIRQDYREVARLLQRLGLQDIVAVPGVVTARAPGGALQNAAAHIVAMS